MRTKRFLGLTGAVALVGAVMVAAIASAAKTTEGSDTQNNVTQSIEAGIAPTKVPKKGKGKGVELTTGVGVVDTSTPHQQEPAAHRAIIKYGKDLKINNKGLAKCDPNEISTQNTQSARRTCKKALVGTGTAQATCSANPTPDLPDITVSAFNGPKNVRKRGARPSGTILLHTTTVLGGTTQITVVPGQIGRGSGKFGTEVDFEVPPLAGGVCSFLNFLVDIEKSYKKKGKKQDYVTATCKNKNKGIPVGGDFLYDPNPQGVSELNPETAATCKQKK